MTRSINNIIEYCRIKSDKLVERLKDAKNMPMVKRERLQTQLQTYQKIIDFIEA